MLMTAAQRAAAADTEECIKSFALRLRCFEGHSSASSGVCSCPGGVAVQLVQLTEPK